MNPSAAIMLPSPPDDESRPPGEPANAEEVVTSHPSHTTSQHKSGSAEYINGWVQERERHADLGGLVDDACQVGS
jgi:hypothetical protein